MDKIKKQDLKIKDLDKSRNIENIFQTSCDQRSIPIESQKKTIENKKNIKKI